MFEPFPKLTRFSQDWTVTEKIDGSNAQIYIFDGSLVDEVHRDTFYDLCDHAIFRNDEYYVCAGSRSRFLAATKQGDHMGFARWVTEHAEKLIKTLGLGRHYGEWWGQGIQRGYDLKEKRFSLFNVGRWKEEDVTHVPGLHVVPNIGFKGQYLDEPGKTFNDALDYLKKWGSLAAPGYMNPEGIVMFHGRSGAMFKKTFDYDEQGKWAEKHDKGEHIT